MFELRDYQVECLTAIADAYQRGVQRPLVALPTGSGKTEVFARLEISDRERMLVIAHRRELLSQAADKIGRANPGRMVGFEQGKYRASPMDRVVVASVQSVGRSGGDRLLSFDPVQFGQVVVDEAHHAIAATYRTVLDHFGVFKGGGARLLGVTATPKRGDNIGLEAVFQEIVYSKSILDMIRDGWLANIRPYAIRTGTDLSSVKTRAGEFNQRDLADTVNTSERNALVLAAYQEITPDAKALVFCVDIEHAEAMADMFNSVRIDAAAITQHTPNRQNLLNRFRAGYLRVLTNVDVLTEGYDEPSIETIILARPTQSATLYTQMVGRGTRKAPGKDDVFLLDVVDNTGRHQLATVNSLAGLPSKWTAAGGRVTATLDRIAEAKEKWPDLDTENLESMDDVEELMRPDVSGVRRSLSELGASRHEVRDLFEPVAMPEITSVSELDWLKLHDEHYRLPLPTGAVDVVIDALGRWHWEHANKQGPVIAGQGLDLAEAVRAADKHIRETDSEAIKILNTNARWRSDGPSEKQEKYIRHLEEKLGRDAGLYFSESDGWSMSRGQCHDWISKALMTLKQGVAV